MISDEEIKKCKSLSDICRLFGKPINGRCFAQIKEILHLRGISENLFKKKEKIYYCNYCGKKLEKKKKFCDNSCSAKFNNKNRKHSKESKEKTSKSLKNFYEKNNQWNLKKEKLCEYCGHKFKINKNKNGRFSNKKYCSEECRTKSKSEKLSKAVKERIKNGTHNGWKSRNILSYPEKFFIKVLKNNNLYDKCKHNYSINKKEELGVNEPYNYFLDFYFEDKKICLEIDGKQHKNRKDHDELRDKRLENVGIKVYRIEWKSINNDNGKKYIKKEIEKFLDFYKNAPVARPLF